MTNEDVRKILELRNYIGEYVTSLEGRDNPGSVTQTRDVVAFCVSLGKSIDDLISDRVTFK